VCIRVLKKGEGVEFTRTSLFADNNLLQKYGWITRQQALLNSIHTNNDWFTVCCRINDELTYVNVFWAVRVAVLCSVELRIVSFKLCY
jgi:hypothetical protein